MSNRVEIDLYANTTNFETGLTKANNLFNQLATTGGDVGKKISKSLGEINSAAKGTSDEFQKMLNLLNVKSDIQIKVETSHITEAKQVYENLFAEIASGAKASGVELSAMMNALNLAKLNIDMAPLANQFKQLGIQSSASIEAMKLKAVMAFEEIERVG